MTHRPVIEFQQSLDQVFKTVFTQSLQFAADVDLCFYSAPQGPRGLWAGDLWL